MYSRITGYYRPVKNWNDGKSQEFKDRKVYNIGTSVLTHSAPVAEPTAPVDVAPAAPVVEDAPVEVPTQAKAILFSRVTCPNCRVAETLLGKANVAYEKRIADQDLDLCRQYGVKGAPTLVITDGENHVNYYSVPEIKKYLASI